MTGAALRLAEALIARPSVQRVLAEAKPYFPMYPFYSDIPARFL